MREQALVLGAGIQGISCALALSASGYAVTLIDQQPEPFGGTSFRNEGKIHLGFVYANDRSLQTADLMLNGAMHFGPLLDRWLGHRIDWSDLRSTPFRYVIHRDSMVSQADLLAHYEQLQTRYEAYRETDLHYVGQRPDILWHMPEPVRKPLCPDYFQAVIPTQEIALNLTMLRQLALTGLRSQGIQFLGNRTVQAVERTSAGFRVKGNRPDGSKWQTESGLVVNCLWAGRLAVDASLGITPQQPWVYRLKFRMLGKLPPSLASLCSHTIALGPFGDLVTFPHAPTYVSWYPTCMRGWSDALLPPAEWASLCQQEQPLIDNEWVQQALTELDQLVPGMRQFRIDHLSAGVIFSWGETDIDQPESQLHQRDQIGVEAHDGYFSINTGKLTTAPLFAHRLQQLVCTPQLNPV